MRHLRALGKALFYGFFAGQNFILVSGDLFRTMVLSLYLTIPVIDGQGLEIIDILHYCKAFCSVDDPLPVRKDPHRAVKNCHFPSRIDQCNTVLGVYAGICHNGSRYHFLYLIAKDHRSKIQGIYPNVQKRSAAQFRLQKSRHVSDKITEICSERHRRSDSSLGQYLTDGIPHRHVPYPHGLSKQHSFFPGQLCHFSGLLLVYGKSFFT